MSKLKDIIVSDRYKIKHFIESSEFCEIYSANELSSGKLVLFNVYNVSKISKDDLDDNDDLREISFLKLGIDGFPKLLGFGSFNNQMQKYRYIATEFISGESVLDRIKRNGSLTEFDSINVCSRLFEIASSLHSRQEPILLNGLSLNNIMFDMSGESETIILRNLINVRHLGDDFKYKFIDGVIANNLAPECFNDVFNEKTDLYNICSILYQMLHGYCPWHDDQVINFSNKESIDRHLKKRNLDLKFAVFIDKHLQLFFRKALNQNSDERFRNIPDIITFLNRDKILTETDSNTSKKNMQIKAGDGFNDIAGMDDLKNQLNTQVLEVLRRPDHFKKYGVSVPNGMLLYGPPGCGKTFISEKFCEEASFNFYLVKPSDLSSIYVSGGEEKIGQLFDDAEKNSPSIICFDEVDAIMPNRSDDSHQSISSRVNEFLSQINKCSNRGIFIIATTNKPELIDPAILRTGRLEIQIYIPPPDKIARKKLFELYLKNRYCEPQMDYEELGKLTNNLVSSDIEFIVNQASHTAAMKDIRISMSILKEVISSFIPSISKEIIDSYEIQHNSFKNSEKKGKRNQIGFRINKNN